jgi:hypothetical protein
MTDEINPSTDASPGNETTRGRTRPLVRLRESGRVDHRGKYWRISDHKRSLDDAVDHAGAVAASHEEESFEYEEWMEHAVDPRENRE